MLIPSPCVTDSRTLILWSQDPVPSFVRFSDIPFPYGINILVATLFIFRERATTGKTSSILSYVALKSGYRISHHKGESSPFPIQNKQNKQIYMQQTHDMTQRLGRTSLV